MNQQPQQQRDSAASPGDEDFELFGRRVRVSLSAFDHIGIRGTPEGMVSSSTARTVQGSIRGNTVVRPRRHLTVLLLLSPVLLALVAWGWQPDQGASAAPRPTVALRCDTSVLELEHGARLQRRWQAQLEPVLAHAGLRLVHATEHHSRIIRVRVVAFDEDLHDYQIRLELIDGAHMCTLPTISCEACSEAKLAALVAEHARTWLTP